MFFHAYGIAYVFAVAAAIAISRWGWRQAGGDPELPLAGGDLGLSRWSIGGRVYFDITTPSQIPDHWWGVFAIWQGGLGIWGGIAGGVAGGWYVLRKRLPPGQRAQFMDVAVPGLLVAQATGRIGNYFNQELFGAPSNLPWALQIAPVHRPAGYLAFRTFEPTFLYELIWDLLVAGFLAWLGTRRRVRAPGLFALLSTGSPLAIPRMTSRAAPTLFSSRGERRPLTGATAALHPGLARAPRRRHVISVD